MATRFDLIALSQSDDSESVEMSDIDLGEFYMFNESPPEECAEIEALPVGGEYRIGGGAAPLFAVRRVA